MLKARKYEIRNSHSCDVIIKRKPINAMQQVMGRDKPSRNKGTVIAAQYEPRGGIRIDTNLTLSRTNLVYRDDAAGGNRRDHP